MSFLSLSSTPITTKWAFKAAGDPEFFQGSDPAKELSGNAKFCWTLPRYLMAGSLDFWVCLVELRVPAGSRAADSALIFMKLNDLKQRLTPQDVGELEKKWYQDNDPKIEAYLCGGERIRSLPNAMSHGGVVTRLSTGNAKERLQSWREIADRAERYSLSKPFDPKARYWKPSNTSAPPGPAVMPPFTLVPGKGVTVADLTDVKNYIFDNNIDVGGITRDSVVISDKPPSAQPASRNLFGLWSLYVDSASLWGRVYTPWAPKFPPTNAVEMVHEYIVNARREMSKDRPARRDADFKFAENERTVQTTITNGKIHNAAGEVRNPDQQTVMNGVSATYPGQDGLFDEYPAFYQSPSKYGAEWLHRSAFSFGGLGDSSDFQTSQTVKNLIYGFYEANTNMMRAESAIKSVIKYHADVAKAKGGHSTCYASLETSLVNSHIRTNHCQRFGDNVTTSTPDNDFVNARYTWITPSLHYHVTLYQDGKLLAGGETYFDPFVRLMPTMLEVAIDELLIERISSQLPQASPTTSPAKLGFFVQSNPKPHAAKLVVHDSPLSNPHVSSSHPDVSSVAHTSIPTASIRKPVAALLRTPDAIRGELSSVPHTIHPSVLSAWDGGTRNVPSIRLHGLTVKHPQILDRPSISASDPSTQGPSVVPQSSVVTHDDSMPVQTEDFPVLSQAAISVPPPPDGFVLTGNISLFGLTDLQAKFYSWHGPPPAWVHLTSVVPVYQMAKLSKDLKISTIIPLLKSTPFDKFGFKNTSFTYQNYNFVKDRELGLHIDADLEIDSSFGIIHDILVNVFRIAKPTLHMHAALGEQNFAKGLVVRHFAIDGTFTGVKVKPFDGLELTEIGLRLYGIPSSSYPDWKEHMAYNFDIFGKMVITAPSGPLVLSYMIGGGNGVANLSAGIVGDVWSDAFGVKGLTLSAVGLNARFSVKAPLKSLQFDVEAAFDGGSVTAYFVGSYALGGNYSLTATVNNFGCDGVLDIFKNITGGSLELPNIDVEIGSATLVIASGSGLTITLSDLIVSSFSAFDATLHISDNGVMVQGNLTENSNISLGEVDLTKAFIRISFAKSASGKTTDVIFGGQVLFQGIIIDAAVHLYPSSDGTGHIEWTIFGAMSSSGDLSLSDLVHDLKGSFLDGIVLRNAAFVVASKDDPSLGTVLSKPYPIHQGVQICAELGELQALNALTRSSTPNLLLSAGWSSASGFVLNVLLPTPSTVSLGMGVTTDPFTLQIQTKPPSLRLNAGVKVSVPKQSEPLDFMMSLDLNLIEGKATGQMHGYWMNPFGISDSVKIGPDLALSVEIIFAQFITTGTPSGLGFVGGIQIGKVMGQVALNISEDPMREVLYAEVKALDINDVVSLARDVTKLDIPQPPNFLDFEDVKLYVCPAGTTIGTIVYPQGFSFAAVMIIFGKKADVAVAISNSDIKIAGGVDNFSLGPLVVRGQHGPRATLDVQIGTAIQKAHIDGLIELFDANASLILEFNVLPSPTLQFDLVLHFTDLLTFDVHASLLGNVGDLHDLSGLDFVFLATLEQHILSYVNDQLQAQFAIAKHAAEQGIDDATEKVSAAQKALDAQITSAQTALDLAFEAWQVKSDAVHKSSQQVIDAYNAQFQQLQSALDRAKGSFDAAMQNAQRSLENANRDRGQKMAAAEASLEATRNDWTNRIQSAQRDVDNAQNKMNNDVKDAQDKLTSAQNSVNSIQSQIDDCQRRINDAQSNPIPIPPIPSIPSIPIPSIPSIPIPSIPSIPVPSWPSWPWSFAVMPAPAASVASFSIFDGGALSLPALYAELGSLQAAKAVASAALTAASAAMTGGAIAADQVALGAARQVLSDTRSSGNAAIQAAQSSVQLTDQATAAAVSAAQGGVSAAQNGADSIAFTAARQAMENFRIAGDATLKTAQEAVEALVQSAEWLAYQSASAALAAAKAATPALQAANAALKVAQDAADDILTAAQWIATHGTGLFDVQEILLSGTLKAIVTGGDAFKAEVKGKIASQSFDVQLTFDPRKTGEFLGDLFTQLWGEIQSGIANL